MRVNGKDEYFELQPEFFRRYDNTVRYNIDTDNNYDYDDDTMNDNDNDNNDNDTIPAPLKSSQDDTGRQSGVQNKEWDEDGE